MHIYMHCMYNHGVCLCVKDSMYASSNLWTLWVKKVVCHIAVEIIGSA